LVRDTFRAKTIFEDCEADASKGAGPIAV